MPPLNVKKNYAKRKKILEKFSDVLEDCLTNGGSFFGFIVLGLFVSFVYSLREF
jgi:hypothetical protein